MLRTLINYHRLELESQLDDINAAEEPARYAYLEGALDRLEMIMDEYLGTVVEDDDGLTDSQREEARFKGLDIEDIVDSA